ncbi:CAP domain-containing protein [Herminiimonas sp. CN]|uniref:CAP domain-containing protein n=1 Tax=Herminiimonas sp. CN TaxID=1349818 RepID=UPI0004739F95|nr:CAP domain-containing protein [Herminiimonas sp. CN]
MARLSPVAPAIILSLALAACGGGGGSPTRAAPAPAAAITGQQLAQETNAPQITGNMATDGLNWFNFRRQQIMLPSLTRNGLVDIAAQGHSEYQKLNNTITHDQIPGNPGFTGIDLPARLSGAGYGLIPSYAIGEVIAKVGNADGFAGAEALITAIYHRFVIFEPMFKEAGAGYATAASGYTYFTTDFAASNGLGQGLGTGNFSTYPYEGQKNLPNNFFSDAESPDPVPGKNEVGYPVSIHADITTKVTVQNFTVRPHGGALLPVQLLTSTTDTETPTSAAAIIPLAPLATGTTYDVAFSGSICAIKPDNTCVSPGTPVAKNWSFTTR